MCDIRQHCFCLPLLYSSELLGRLFHCSFPLYTFRQENSVCKFAIRQMRGIFGISDVLQFASVQDLVHFFTQHSFEIGVKLIPMNVTEHCQFGQQLSNGGPLCARPLSQVSDDHSHLYLYSLSHLILTLHVTSTHTHAHTPSNTPWLQI